MKRLRAREKLKLAQLEAAQLKEVIEEEKAQNELKQKMQQEENELKQRIWQKEARRKLELANAQYEIWMEADVKAERDLEVKSRDPLGSSQIRKSFLFKLNPFPRPLVTPFQVHHHN